MPQTVVIDDQLPMLNETMTANAGPSKGNGWWLPLLEKAYAKINVNYENLNRGSSLNQVEALRALTGAPVEQVSVHDPLFVKKMKEYLKSNYSISAYVERKVNETYGLKRKMSYNILEINVESEEDDKPGPMYDLIMRDPWTNGGSVSYEGGDEDDSDDLLEVGSDVESTFMMTKEKFSSVFESVNVALTSPNWQILRKNFKKDTD